MFSHNYKQITKYNSINNKQIIKYNSKREDFIALVLVLLYSVLYFVAISYTL